MRARTSQDLSDPGKIQVIQFNVLCGLMLPSCLVAMTSPDWLRKNYKAQQCTYYMYIMFYYDLCGISCDSM